MMMVLLQMLTQQIFTVIISIGRADRSMNVLPRRAFAFERRHGDRLLVIKLDQDDRAVDSVVEHCFVVDGSDPREVGVRQMLLDLRQLNFGVAIVHVGDVLIRKI